LMKKKQILVTGSSGQLGSELQQLVKDRPQWQFHFHGSKSLDVTNPQAIGRFFQEQKPDICINCAAYTAVDKAETEREQAFAINAHGPANLADLCAAHETSLIHISTDYVFNGLQCRPYREDDHTAPSGFYGRSKNVGEQKVLEKLNRALVIRTSGVYSSFGHNFVKTMLRLGQEREELHVVFDQAFTPTYARHLAAAILDIIAQLDKNPAYGLYHYSNEGVCSWFDFAVAIMRSAGVECQVYPIETFQYPTPAKRPPYSVLNKAKVKQTFGLSIPHWQEGLEQCLHEMETKP